MSNDMAKPLERPSAKYRSLSFRILLTLFLSFLSFELLLLYPITRFYEIHKLNCLEQQALVTIHTLFASASKMNVYPNENAQHNVSKIANSIMAYPLFKGIVIAREDENFLFHQGEKPSRSMNALPKLDYLSANLRETNGTRYDVTWNNDEDHLPFDVTVRLDTSHLSAEIEKFIWTTIGIMLIIALFNSMLAFVIFNNLVLKPFYKLKEHFLNIANHPAHLERWILKKFSDAEFGDIEKSCNTLLKRAVDAGKVLKAHDALFEMREEERSKELSQLANFNPITDLPNRNLLRETLAKYIEKAKEENNNIAVMFLRLRDFHEINNVYGQIIGTQFLKAVSHNLIENTPNGTFIAQLSTSHFAIARTGFKSAHQITNLAQWLLEIFNKPLLVADKKLLTTVNIGIAIFPIDANDAEGLMSNSNLALNRAIEAAPNSYQFYEANMNKITQARRSILVDLHYAIERNQLVAYYQPQVNLQNNQIIGVEALLRWMHPEKGFMPPGFFISLAEESGLIIPMGEWILKTACHQIKKWEAAGLPKLTMAVNLSGAQFKQKNILEVIHSALTESELPAEQLELEITESIIVDNIQTAIATLKGLRGLGLSVSIDDFGTGYSSLSYLRSFPIQKLKIDQSFVRDIGQTGDEKPIADIILLLAQNLNIHSIAEGIETEEQAEYLRSRGCQEGQGYLFGKPMSADEIQALFNHKS